MDRPHLRYFSFCFSFDLMFFLIGGREGGGGELCDSLLISSYMYISSIVSLPPPTDFKRDSCHVVE